MRRDHPPGRLGLTGTTEFRKCSTYSTVALNTMQGISERSSTRKEVAFLEGDKGTKRSQDTEGFDHKKSKGFLIFEEQSQAVNEISHGTLNHPGTYPQPQDCGTMLSVEYELD